AGVVGRWGAGVSVAVGLVRGGGTPPDQRAGRPRSVTLRVGWPCSALAGNSSLVSPRSCRERGRPRPLDRRRLACVAVTPGRRDAARPAGGTPALRYDTSTVTSACACSALAGNSSLTSPLRRRSIAARLFAPLASRTILRDERIVPMPIVIACVG